MEGGTQFFNGEVPFAMEVEGAINGTPFKIVGKGIGDSTIGFLKGKWVCTSGKLPISWAAIAGTLGYGSKVFVKYPNGITDFFHECFPAGYSQDRVLTFEDGGVLKGYHEVTLNKGLIFNKVTLNGEGFAADSPVINDGIKNVLPTCEYTYPFENGIKSIVNHVYPLKCGSGVALAHQVTVNKPLANVAVKQPLYHLANLEIKQAKDVDDCADHICQEEMAVAFEHKLLCD